MVGAFEHRSLLLNIDHLQDGFTPVVAAVERHQVDVVKILCEKRADVEICNEKGAAKMHQTKIAKKHTSRKHKVTPEELYSLQEEFL